MTRIRIVLFEDDEVTLDVSGAAENVRRAVLNYFGLRVKTEQPGQVEARPLPVPEPPPPVEPKPEETTAHRASGKRPGGRKLWALDELKTLIEAVRAGRTRAEIERLFPNRADSSIKSIVFTLAAQGQLTVEQSKKLYPNSLRYAQ